MHICTNIGKSLSVSLSLSLYPKLAFVMVKSTESQRLWTVLTGCKRVRSIRSNLIWQCFSCMTRSSTCCCWGLTFWRWRKTRKTHGSPAKNWTPIDENVALCFVVHVSSCVMSISSSMTPRDFISNPKAKNCWRTVESPTKSTRFPLSLSLSRSALNGSNWQRLGCQA